MKIASLFSKTRRMLAVNVNDREGNMQAARFLTVMACALAVTVPGTAFAGAPWDNAADWVLSVLNGGLTRSIAIICVISCGIAAWAGKLSVEWAVKIVIGIVLVFGAAFIVDAISGAVA